MDGRVDGCEDGCVDGCVDFGSQKFDSWVANLQVADLLVGVGWLVVLLTRMYLVWK